MLEDGSSVIGYLTTTGRVTGKPHTVPLRLVYYQGKVYASRREARGDWYRNLLKNPNVTVMIEGSRFAGIAEPVTDEALCQNISQLKYADERGREKRIVVEITLVSDE